MNRVSEIKRAQKESLLFRELSGLFMKIVMEQPALQLLTLTHVKLSQDKGACSIYFYANGGRQAFEDSMSTLILYKPSMRKALSQSIPGRYTPELIFRFDEQFEKQQRMEKILDTIKTEEQS